MDFPELIVPKEEPDSDCDVDNESSTEIYPGEENHKILTKFKEEFPSDKFHSPASPGSLGQVEKIEEEEDYIISKFEVVEDLIPPVPEEPNWDCPLCLKQLPVHMELRDHLRTHSIYAKSKEEPRCPICGIIFNRLTKLFSHIVSYHKNTSRKQGEKGATAQSIKIKKEKEQKSTSEDKSKLDCKTCDETVPPPQKYKECLQYKW